MEYTTKELAEICGVSSQSIRNFIKENNGGEATKEVRGRFVINENLARNVCEHFGKELPSQPKTKIENEKSEPSKDEEVGDSGVAAPFLLEQIRIKDEQIKALQEELKMSRESHEEQLRAKDEQLRSRDEQIEKLLDTNKALSVSNAVQVAAEKKELLLVENQEEEKKEEPKKGFWQRIFGF